MEIITVGIDPAKSIFQVHAVDAAGQVVVRKALRRAQVVPFFAKLPRCLDRKSTRLNSSHSGESRMPSSA